MYGFSKFYMAGHIAKPISYSVADFLTYIFGELFIGQKVDGPVFVLDNFELEVLLKLPSNGIDLIYN